MTIEELSVQFEVEFSQVKTAVASIKSQFDSLESNVTSSTNKVSKGVSGIGSTVKAIVGSQIILSLAKQFVQLAVQGVQSAMSVESSLNNLNRTLGTSASYFVNWAEEVGIAYGMATEDALSYGSTYANLISGFTSGTEETTALTIDLMETASVVASATGRTFEDTAERIRSGLLGNTEAIEDLGIYANVAMIETTNAFKEMANGSSWESLDYNTQQQIRLMSILEQASEKYGDTIANTTSARHNTFVASLQNVKTALGQAFLPIYNVILPALTALAQAIAKVLGYIAQFMNSLFGVESSVASSLGSATTSSGLSGVTETVEEDLEGANTEAKKLKGQLMGFDEINTLSLETDTSGSGSVDSGTLDGISTGGSLLNLEETVEEADGLSAKMKELAEKVKAWWQSIDFEPLKESMNRFKASLEPFVELCKEAIEFVLVGFLAPLTEITIEYILPAFFNALAWQLEQLAPIVEAVTKIISLFTDTVSNLYKAVKGEISWEEFFSGAKESAKAVWDTIRNMIVSIWKNIVEEIKFSIQTSIEFWTNAKDIFITVWENIPELASMWWNSFKEIVAYIWEDLKELWGIAKEDLIAIWEIMPDWFKKLWNAIADYVTDVWEIQKELFSNAKDILVAVWETVPNWIGNIWDSIKTGASNMWDRIVERTSTARESFNTIWENVSSWIGERWTGVKDGAGSMWDNIKEWTSSARESFNSAWDNVSSWISEKWEGIKSTFNSGLSVIVTWGSSAWTSFRDGWTSVFSSIGSFFSSVWQGIGSSFSSVVTSMWSMFTNTFSSLYSWLNSTVLTPITNGFNTFMSSCKSIVNTVIGWVNKLISGINKISFDIPELLGGGSIGFSIPTVPYLARGGIISQPTLAMVGEAGTEAVVPLEDTSFVNTIASAIGSAVLSAMNISNMNSNNSNDKEVVIQIDGTQLARVMNSYNQRENKRVGTKLVSSR